MNGEPSAEYPLNKFSPKEKGIDSDSFYDGRDGRHWMLGTGLHLNRYVIPVVRVTTEGADKDLMVWVYKHRSDQD